MIKTDNWLHLLGGVDINPALYGQKPDESTQPPNNKRDAEEMAAYKQYVSKGLPIIGVCRGAQLLCVLNGGQLYQDSMGHNFGHGLQTKDKYIPEAAAGHHQIMRLDGIPDEDYHVYAWCPYHTKVVDENGVTQILEAAPEVVWFPKTKSLCIQPHPEWEREGTPFWVYINNLTKELLGIEQFF